MKVFLIQAEKAADMVAKASAEVKERDELDILLSGKHVRLKVLSVQEHALKADASGMYELLPEGNA